MSKFYYRRLFRRGRARYEGIVHKQLVVDGDFITEEIRVYHHGYNLSPEQMAEKHKRTERLLANQLENNPDDVFARYNMVHIHRAMEKYDVSSKEAVDALAKTPYEEHPGIYLMLLLDGALSFLQINQYKKAMELCKDGLAKDPNNIDLLSAFGVACSEMGNYKMAVTQYRRWQKAKHITGGKPKFPVMIVETWSMEALIWDNMGKSYFLMDDFDNAKKCFEKAIEIDPDNPRFYRSLAWIYAERNDLAKVLPILEQAEQRGIADDFFYFKMGEIYRLQFRYVESKQAYEKSL
jgi:tetratricopeptide (TPR) repeat protein